MYVRQLSINMPHMVLTYHKNKDNIYILDNYNAKLLKSHERKDLRPVFSFNNESVWISHKNKIDKKVNNHKGIRKFKDLINRIKKQEISLFTFQIDN